MTTISSKCRGLQIVVLFGLLLLGPLAVAQRKSEKSDPLPNTQPLTMEGDLAAQMVDGIDKFLLKQWDQTSVERFKYWKELVADEARVKKEFPELRKELAKMLGAHEPRIPPEQTHHVAIPLAATDNFVAATISWPVLRDVHVEGLLVVQDLNQLQRFNDDNDNRRSTVIVIPDADQMPEDLIGLTGKVPPQFQFPRHLAERGHIVFIPFLIDRKMEKRNGRSVLSNREFAYRPAFELGRHLIGYELQKILSAVDLNKSREPGSEIRIFGYGEGGLLALYAAALDERVTEVGVSGYFGAHTKQWDEPLDRNVFGINKRFGTAELVAFASRHCKIVIEESEGPQLALPGNGGGAPSVLGLTREEIAEERVDLGNLKTTVKPAFCTAMKGEFFGPAFCETIGLKSVEPPSIHEAPKFRSDDNVLFDEKKIAAHIALRAQRQLDQIINDTQRLLVDSPYVRQEFMKKLDTSSLDKYKETVEPYRETFAKDVIGRFEIPLLPPQPKSRQVYDEEKWTGYEVVLDVFPDVYAYGLLLIPKDIPAGEKRPVVVCQHGLEGRPQDVIGDEKRNIYEAFAAKLAERGFITFAPQNLYIGRDRFRTLQRKANPLGKTLFSIMVPQHQQIVNWLGSLPMVDKSRIAFYGLSYGGKSAMRIPPLVPEYSAVICSADFNEWVWKNASVKSPYSYVWTNEYEIFEWDLGSTFNYAEMAALICPRPFMVERGHFDGVSSDEAVAYEYAKVQFLYQAKLKLPGKCEIEFFDGPHKINGKGTFDFLHRHLNWPKKE